MPLTEPAAQPGEGHTVPSSMVEVKGSSALLDCRSLGQGMRLPKDPLSSDLFQAPLPETDSQPLPPSSGPFSEVSRASCPGWSTVRARSHSGSSCSVDPQSSEQLRGGPPPSTTELSAGVPTPLWQTGILVNRASLCAYSRDASAAHLWSGLRAAVSVQVPHAVTTACLPTQHLHKDTF